MRSRHTSTAAATCSAGRSASDRTGCGPLTITSWAPVAGSAVNSSGLPRAGSAISDRLGLHSIVRVRRGQRRVEVRHHPHRPPGRVRRPTAGAQRVELRRSAVLVTLGERVALGVDRLCRSAGRLAPGTPGALSGDDRLVPAQRVDPDLRHGSVSIRKLCRARSVGHRLQALPRSGTDPGGCSARPRGRRRRSRA